MCKHSRDGVTAQRDGKDMALATRTPFETPAGLTAGKAAQLHALLFVTHSGAGETFGDLSVDIQDGLLSLAAGLAQEVLVLSELAAQQAMAEVCHA